MWIQIFDSPSIFGPTSTAPVLILFVSILRTRRVFYFFTRLFGSINRYRIQDHHGSWYPRPMKHRECPRTGIMLLTLIIFESMQAGLGPHAMTITARLVVWKYNKIRHHVLIHQSSIIWVVDHTWCDYHSYGNPWTR